MSISSAAVKVFALFVLGFSLSACATLPKFDDAPYWDEVPSAWADTRGAGAEEIDGTWWTGFGDPKLNAFITSAVGENYQVWQAEARTAQARALAVIAGADRLPQIGAGIGAEATRRGAGAAGFSTIESYGVNLNVDWEIDLWGRLAAQSEAARERYLASTDALRGVRQSIAAQTAKTYFAVVETRQQVALSQRTVEVMSETARQVGNRSDVGIASPSDKFLALSNRDSAAAGLAANDEVLDRTTRQLQFLLRDYPDGEIDTARDLVDVPPLPAVGVPASLLARRPDVIAAERELRASGFDVAVAERSLLPAISLSGGVGTASAELKDILNGDFSFWTLAGNLLQPVFQGGRLRANVELNDAEQREAAAAYAETVLNALSEVEAALAVRDDIDRRRTALCSAAAAAKSAEEVAFNRYRQGVEPFLTVLESQQRTLDASSNCIAARRAGLDNHIDLHLALGGGFEEAPAPPETVETLVQKRFDLSEWKRVIPGTGNE